MGKVDATRIRMVGDGSYLPPGFVSGLVCEGLSSFGVVLLLYFLGKCEFGLMHDKDGAYFDVCCDPVAFGRGYIRMASVDLVASESKISRSVSELIRFGYMKRSGKEAKLELKSVFRNYIRRKQTL